MNATTKVVLGTFIALTVLVAVVSLWPEEGAGPGLNVPGWSQGHDVDKPEANGPIDKIEVDVGGRKAVLERVDEDHWKMTPPDGARADRYKVRRILQNFREDLTSVISSSVTPESVEAFGLDPGNRILVKLYKKGALFTELEIGAVQKPEEGYGDGDTFVRKPGSDRVYRIIGKDMRRVFDGGIKGLRDRRLFGFESGDVTAIEIDNPSAKNQVDQHIVLKSEPVDRPAGEDTGKKKKTKRSWKFVEPSRFQAGDIKSFAGTIAAVYVQEYVDEPPRDARFGSEAYRLKVTLDGGRVVSMTLSPDVEDVAYIKVDGRADFAKVSKYTARSLRKGVGDLRDKSVFGITKEEILRVAIREGGKNLVVSRAGDGYRCIRPSGMPLGKSQVESLFSGIETLKAKEWLAPEQAKGADTGLDRPSLVVRVTTMDRREIVLKVGKEKEKGARYAEVSWSPELFTIAGWALNKVRKGPDDLRNKKLFDFGADRMKRIEIEHADETLVLERKDDGEGKNAWKAVKPADKADLDQAALKTLVNTLAGLMIKDFQHGKKATEVGLGKGVKPELAVTVVLDDGSRHTVRISGRKSGGDPYAVSPTEKDFLGMVFTLNQYQVKNFDKRLAEL